MEWGYSWACSWALGAAACSHHTQHTERRPTHAPKSTFTLSFSGATWEPPGIPKHGKCHGLSGPSLASFDPKCMCAPSGAWARLNARGRELRGAEASAMLPKLSMAFLKCKSLEAENFIGRIMQVVMRTPGKPIAPYSILESAARNPGGSLARRGGGGRGGRGRADGTAEGDVPVDGSGYDTVSSSLRGEVARFTSRRADSSVCVRLYIP